MSEKEDNEFYLSYVERMSKGISKGIIEYFFIEINELHDEIKSLHKEIVDEKSLREIQFDKRRHIESVLEFAQKKLRRVGYLINESEKLDRDTVNVEQLAEILTFDQSRIILDGKFRRNKEIKDEDMEQHEE